MASLVLTSSLAITNIFSSSFLFSGNDDVDNWLGAFWLLAQATPFVCKMLIGSRLEDDLLSSRYGSSWFILLTLNVFSEMSLWASVALRSNVFG